MRKRREENRAGVLDVEIVELEAEAAEFLHERRGRVDTLSPSELSSDSDSDSDFDSDSDSDSDSVAFVFVSDFGCGFDLSDFPSFAFFRYTLISNSFWFSSLSDTSTLRRQGIVAPFGITTLYPASVSMHRSYGSKSMNSSDRISSSVTPIQLAHYGSKRALRPLGSPRRSPRRIRSCYYWGCKCLKDPGSTAAHAIIEKSYGVREHFLQIVVNQIAIRDAAGDQNIVELF